LQNIKFYYDTGAGKVLLNYLGTTPAKPWINFQTNSIWFSAPTIAKGSDFKIIMEDIINPEMT